MSHHHHRVPRNGSSSSTSNMALAPSLLACLRFASALVPVQVTPEAICTKTALGAIVLAAHRLAQAVDFHEEQEKEQVDPRRLLAQYDFGGGSLEDDGHAALDGICVGDVSWDFEGLVAQTLEMELQEVDERARGTLQRHVCVLLLAAPSSSSSSRGGAAPSADTAVVWFPYSSSVSKKPPPYLLYVVPGRVKVVKSLSELMVRLLDEMPTLKEPNATYKVWTLMEKKAPKQTTKNNKKKTDSTTTTTAAGITISTAGSNSDNNIESGQRPREPAHHEQVTSVKNKQEAQLEPQDEENEENVKEEELRRVRAPPPTVAAAECKEEEEEEQAIVKVMPPSRYQIQPIARNENPLETDSMFAFPRTTSKDKERSSLPSEPQPRSVVVAGGNIHDEHRALPNLHCSQAVAAVVVGPTVDASPLRPSHGHQQDHVRGSTGRSVAENMLGNTQPLRQSKLHVGQSGDEQVAPLVVLPEAKKEASSLAVAAKGTSQRVFRGYPQSDKSDKDGNGVKRSVTSMFQFTASSAVVAPPLPVKAPPERCHSLLEVTEARLSSSAVGAVAKEEEEEPTNEEEPPVPAAQPRAPVPKKKSARDHYRSKLGARGWWELEYQATKILQQDARQAAAAVPVATTAAARGSRPVLIHHQGRDEQSFVLIPQQKQPAKNTEQQVVAPPRQQDRRDATAAEATASSGSAEETRPAAAAAACVSLRATPRESAVAIGSVAVAVHEAASHENHCPARELSTSRTSTSRDRRDADRDSTSSRPIPVAVSSERPPSQQTSTEQKSSAFGESPQATSSAAAHTTTPSHPSSPSSPAPHSPPLSSRFRKTRRSHERRIDPEENTDSDSDNDTVLMATMAVGAGQPKRLTQPAAIIRVVVPSQQPPPQRREHDDEDQEDDEDQRIAAAASAAVVCLRPVLPARERVPIRKPTRPQLVQKVPVEMVEVPQNNNSSDDDEDEDVAHALAVKPQTLQAPQARQAAQALRRAPPAPSPAATFIDLDPYPKTKTPPTSHDDATKQARQAKLTELRQRKLQQLQRARDDTLENNTKKKILKQAQAQSQAQAQAQTQVQTQARMQPSDVTARRKPTNRQLIQNAIEYTLLAGGSLEKERHSALQAMAESPCDNFIVLLKSAKELKFRALYEHHILDDKAHRIVKLFAIASSSPPVLEDCEVSQFFRYNSGKKEFTAIDGRTFTVKTDACALLEHMVVAKKNKKAANRMF